METETSEGAVVRQAREYRRLGHLARAIALARTVPPSAPDVAEARLLMLRCLLDQGRVLAADAAGEEALPLLPPGAEAEQHRLLHAFCLLFSRRDPEPLRTACRSALEAPEVAGRVRALAMDLQARLVGIEVAMLLRRGGARGGHRGNGACGRCVRGERKPRGSAGRQGPPGDAPPTGLPSPARRRLAALDGAPGARLRRRG